MFTAISFAQNITSKNENANAAQYDLLKKVNQFYPDITLSDKVVNFYIDDNIIDSKQEFDLKESIFTIYKLSIDPDNKRVSFDFVSKENGRMYGQVVVFEGKYVRTIFIEKSKQVEVMVDGKSLFIKKM